jgi:1-acyl-sn-glycerol-3-phosphate acyltransferase
MARKTRYVPANSRAFNRLIKWSYGAWLRWAYGLESRNSAFIQGLKAPYVVVANHVTTRDPFMLGILLPKPVYWITSDGNMRTRFMRFFLRRVGSIPKSKAIPDIETVRLIVEVIRKGKGVVGIFPEGQQSWDGHSLPLMSGTAKLLKLLKVPVVAALIEGGYLSLPRWAWIHRKGRVRVEWKLLFRPEELASLSLEAIEERLKAGLEHDEYEFQARERLPFYGSNRAEHLELGLFMCPVCESVARMRSFGERLHCTACGSTWRLDRYGYLHALGEAGRPTRLKGAGAGLGDTERRFSTIRDWDLWQGGAFAALIAKAEADRPFLSDSGVLLFRGRRMNPLHRIRSGTLVLYPDRLELATLLGERLSFPIASIAGAGVHKRNTLEFYSGRDLYQVRFPLRSISARKWATAMEYFQASGAKKAFRKEEEEEEAHTELTKTTKGENKIT